MTSDVSTIRTVGRGLVLPAFLLALWEIFSHSGLVNRQFLPPLEHVAATAWRELASGELIHALSASLRRDLLGFLLGAGVGVLIVTLLVTPTTVAGSRIANRMLCNRASGKYTVSLSTL